jgi:hypothetical protein
VADPLNPSFETAGTNAGEALEWTLSIVFNGWTIAEFSDVAGTASPLESFEQIPFYRTVNGVLAQMREGPSQGTLDTFTWWSGNWRYRSAVKNGSASVFADGTQLESFNEPSEFYAWTVSGGAWTFEDFSEDAGPAYVLTVTGGTLATFYQGAVTIDMMQLVQPDVVFAVPVPANGTLVTTTPHTLMNGKKMTVRSTGSPPGGTTTNAEYYVVNATSTTLKLSLTLSGAAITLTSSGVGTHLLHADETLFWTDGP